MKATLLAFTCIAALFFASCDKADMEVKKLNSGKGIWQIESLHYESYDATGSNVTSDSTVNDPGELVLFTSTTLNGLFDYYCGVANMYDANGDLTECNPFELYFDETRADIKEGPSSIAGVWTVNESGRRKQEWSIYSVDVNGTLQQKVTMTLKKGERK